MLFNILNFEKLLKTIKDIVELLKTLTQTSRRVINEVERLIILLHRIPESSVNQKNNLVDSFINDYTKTKLCFMRFF